MESKGRPRPVGLIFLAGFAAILSPALGLFGVAVFFQIGPLLNQGPYKPDHYPLGHIVLTLVGICLLVAGWIAAKTAADLWKFRSRGRSLAIVGASILALFALLAILWRPVADLQLAVFALILILGIETIVFLRIPAIRSQFE